MKPVGESRIGSLVRRAFAKDTSKKLSPSQQETQEPHARVKAIIKALNEDPARNHSKEAECKGKLMELILPDILMVADEKHLSVGEVKDWAMALATLLGTLAGMGLHPKAINAALAEANEVSKKAALAASNFIETAGIRKEKKSQGLPNPQGQKTSSEPVSLAESPRDQVIQDLERQLKMESNPEMKLALQGMIESMKKAS